MGASGWAYFVPYQSDIGKALQELRKKAFRDSDYFSLADSTPSSIEELLEINAEEGASSIIDIDHISSKPEFGGAAPLSQQQLIDIFTTDKPTRSMIEKEASQLESLRERWEGTYIIVHKDGLPNEIFFTGYSGD